MTITDEELLALVDGRVDAATATELRRRLTDDLEATARLRAMTRAGDVLARTAAPDDTNLETLSHAIRSGAMDTGAETEVRDSGQILPLPVQHLPRDALPTHAPNVGQRGWHAPLQSAAAIALLAVGLLAGYWGGTAQQTETASLPVWMVRVVDYHTLYARETVAVASTTAAEKIELKDRFEDTLETRIHIPDLRSRSLEFRRGQVLQFEDKPIIQLAYLPDVTGSPVALCLRATTQADTPPAYTQLHGMGVVRWTQRGLTYVLVGHRSQADLLADAHKAVADIEASRTI